jgi:uncharacterized protein (DUF1786 family)
MATPIRPPIRVSIAASRVSAVLTSGAALAKAGTIREAAPARATRRVITKGMKVSVLVVA